MQCRYGRDSPQGRRAVFITRPITISRSTGSDSPTSTACSPEEAASSEGRLLANAAVQIPDVLADPEYAYSDMQQAAGYRTLLGVPMLRGKEPIGVLFLGRKTVEPFTDKQIELVQTFADQAVIAIENVRLFDEVKARTRELIANRSEQQTATSEVLSVISSSAGELEPVFQKMLENATRICGAQSGTDDSYDGERFNTVGGYNVPPAYADTQLQVSFVPHPKSGLGTIARTHQPVHIEDIRTQAPLS